MEDELMREFVAESREHLSSIETDLLAIEEAGANCDDDLLNKVFRAAHSIKGAAGFFDLHTVRELAHQAETVLDLLRSRRMTPNAEITNVLLRAFDKLTELINSPDCGQSGNASVEIEALQSLASTVSSGAGTAATLHEVNPTGKESLVELPAYDLERVTSTCQFVYQLELDLLHDIDRKNRQILRLFHELNELGELLECHIDLPAVGTLDDAAVNRVPLTMLLATNLSVPEVAAFFDVPGDRVRRMTADSSGQPETSTVVPPDTPSEPISRAPISSPEVVGFPREAKQVSAPATTVDDTLRVDVELLDALMNLAGELVLSRNQFQAAIANNNQRMLTSAGQRLSQVTSEIQDAIMRTRLQPIENVFSRLPRVVRDLSNSLGKEVKLEVSGKEVALDRSLVEGLSDPLTHMVRNAIDHGIELPDDRVRAGKTRVGTLRVQARHDAGQVIIEIQDDGKGIDHEKVVQTALAKRLITQEQVKGMTADDRSALILLPGLSTAEHVTQVSGRGVGMDVVKSNLDQLGGQLEISSRVGHGTLFRLKLPLTLTIIPALILSVGPERYAIPQGNVEELLRIRAADRKRRIEVIGGVNVLVLRDTILPLVRLDEFLGLERTYNTNSAESHPDRRTSLADRRSARYSIDDLEPFSCASPEISNRRQPEERRVSATSALEIAVVNTGTFRYALVVESFQNTEEIVVKPLGRDLKDSREYAGATILGDGSVVLILDTSGLAAKAGLTSVSASPRAREHAQATQEAAERDNFHSLLLFRNSPDEQCAVPLEIVRRIERVRGSQVESKGGRRTIQYREHSLPLVALSDAASVPPIDTLGELAVIVTTIYGNEVGLLAAMPVDVFETNAAIDTVTHRQPGIGGSAIIHGKTTLLVELPELVDATYPDWRQNECTAAPPHASGATLLLAEDSDFFRSQLNRFLQSDGHRVIAASDGEEAWEQLVKNHDAVDLVITDIEMPRLTGLELSTRIRGDDRTKNIPIIAVSSLAGEEDIARAKAAGVNEYQIKLDRDTLLTQVRQMLPQAVVAT